MKLLKKIFGKEEPKPTVTAILKREGDNTYVLRIGGVLNKATVSKVEELARREIDSGAKDLKVLFILQDDFLGWKKGDNWGDLDFFSQYGDHIAKIAAVGEARWEEPTLVFLGAGSRRGEVRFFYPDDAAKARAWLVAP